MLTYSLPLVESDELKRLTIDLDLIESQEQTLSKLKSILAGRATESAADQVQLVIEKTSSHLIETQATTDLAVSMQWKGIVVELKYMSGLDHDAADRQATTWLGFKVGWVCAIALFDG